eukprot:GILK01008173.1.p1 GENE.GILK01008173.1~~GILK01008173.1.p1  ORF type:complete len:668 (+),score=75.35 GILK01008173.1:70-2004(+)
MPAVQLQHQVVQNPLAMVNHLFEAKVASVNQAAPPSPNSAFGARRAPQFAGDWGVKAFVEEALNLQDPEAIKQIPSLNTRHDLLRPNSLVRFRCMIQDMFDPEYYVGVYEQISEDGGRQLATCKYQETLDLVPGYEANFNSPLCETFERLPLYCVPIPGETHWAKEASYPPVHLSPTPTQRSKRPLEDDTDQSSMDTSTSGTSSEDAASSTSKRFADSTTVASASMSPESTTALAANTRNFPLPTDLGTPCIVKMYDLEDQIRLNDIIEVIGVYCVTPSLAATPEANGRSEEAFPEEYMAHNPPTSLVPHLHVLTHRNLGRAHPLVHNGAVSTLFASAQPSFPAMRTQIVNVLSRVLGGDMLAAEYVLLNMLSRVTIRKEPLVLGKFSLNLANFVSLVDNPDPTALSVSAAALFQLVSLLLPKVAGIPLSLPVLNQTVLTPRKDYTFNRLTTGALQLTAGTWLLLDETKMASGQLQAQGVQNLQAISSVLQKQLLPYDFQYHVTDFLTDLPVLVASHGKSMLPCDVLLPLAPLYPLPTEPLDMSALTNLHPFRVYCGLASSEELQYDIPEEVSSYLEADFVRARQEDPKVSQDTFHGWMSLARLAALSFGETVLTVDRWNYTRDLERNRASRVAGMATRSAPSS